MDYVALIGTHPARTEANVYVAALGIGVGDHSAHLVGRPAGLGLQRRGAADEDSVAVRGDRAGCARYGDPRVSCSRSLSRRDKLVTLTTQTSFETATARASGTADCATTRRSARSTATTAPAPRLTTYARSSSGGEIGSRHTQRNRRIGLTRFRIQPTKPASVITHTRSAATSR